MSNSMSIRFKKKCGLKNNRSSNEEKKKQLWRQPNRLKQSLLL